MFFKKKSSSQGSENDTSEESEGKTVLPSWFDATCAWCLAEQGIDAGEGSHGICSHHEADFERQRIALENRRKKNRQ